MHKLIVLLLVLFAVPIFHLSAQETLTGRVVDESDGTPIPYTTIGISGTDIGTVSDGNGVFKLVIPETLDRPDATLVFSCVGYTDLDVAISGLTDSNDQAYRLSPFVHEMPEVRVSSKPPKEVFYGNRGRALLTHINYYTSVEEYDDKLGRELGKILNVAPDIKLLEFSFYISSNTLDRIKFRMNLYDLSGEEPEKIRLDKDVLFDVSKKTGRVKVDLEPYHIYLQGYDKIGVTLQWLDSEHDGSKTQSFAIPAGPLSFNGTMYRDKSEATWSFSKSNLSMYVKALRYR